MATERHRRDIGTRCLPRACWSGSSQRSGLSCHQTRVSVTLAACVAFYFSLYVLDDAQMATFAVFGCIALGALSE